MASFVIHHVAGVTFLDKLEKENNIKLTEEQKNQFLLGNLIVDSSKIKFQIPKDTSEEEMALLKKEHSNKVQEEKVSTHFRSSDDKNLCIQVPVVESFVDKYEKIMDDFSVLGYLFHLYTDKKFFDNLFNESFECLDANYNPTKYSKELVYIKSKKNGEVYLATEVFKNDSPVSIYSDYTTMNKLLLEHYNVTLDFDSLFNYASNNFLNPGIEEVDYKNIFNVLKKTAKYIEESYNNPSAKLNIFSDNKVKDFISDLSDNFINKYLYLFQIDHNKIKKLV